MTCINYIVHTNDLSVLHDLLQHPHDLHDNAILLSEFIYYLFLTIWRTMTRLTCQQREVGLTQGELLMELKQLASKAYKRALQKPSCCGKKWSWKHEKHGETLLETPSFLDKFNHVHQIPNTCNDRPSLNPSIFWCHPTWHHEKVFGIIPNASTEPQTDVWWLLMIII